MKTEQSLPDLKTSAERVVESVTDLSPEQQALLMRWLQRKPARPFAPEQVQPPIRRVPRGRPLPLSFAQQRLWFLEQLSPGTSAYNIGLAVRLTGALDVAALRHTFAELVRRHESLRTTFAAVDGRPAQMIADELELELPLTDLSGLGAERREAEVWRLAGEEAERPFSLSQGPLIRTGLLRLAEDEHVLLLTVHHIVSDGWSTGVLVREVGALYEAYARGESSPLAELPVQYADYAAWQREYLSGEVLEAQLAYWREQLAGTPPAMELPTDRPRVARQVYRSARETLALSQDVSEGLKALSRSEGATLFMTLLAGFAAVLSRHSGQQEVVVGTPVAGRTQLETEGLIGVFINALALRVDLTGGPTFRELLRRVRDVTLGAYEHQELPFERLVEELKPDRDPRFPPLFQVALVLQNAPMTLLKLPSLQLSGIEVESKLTKYEMTLTVEDTERGLTATIEYGADLFEAETVRRLLGHLRQLFEGAVADPRRRVAELPLLTDGELSQLAGWNSTTERFPGTHCVHKLFEAQAEKTPAAVALDFEGGSLTYAELNERANRLAHSLRSRGVRAESRVGILMHRSPEMVVGILAVLKAGGAYVPLDAQYPRERLSFMLEDAGIGVLLTRRQLVGEHDWLSGRQAQIVCVDEDPARESPEDARNPSDEATPDSLAYVIYTSGSTGEPKGVAVQHRAIRNRLLWMQAEFPLSASDCVLQKTTASFDASVWELFSPLLAGARLALAEPGGERDAAYLAGAATGFGATVLQLVPSMLRVMLEEARFAECASLRRVFCGGEALAAELPERFRALLPGAELVNLYGPTEVAIDATFWRCGDSLEGEGVTVPIGRPLSNVQVHVLDAHLNPVPLGVAGELYVGGAGVTRGYLNRPELTAEKFVPDPFGGAAGARLYRTGDVARRLAGGELEFVGRADGQVKVRGFRIELGEVEAALRGHGAVGECVAAAREVADGHRQLVAYFVPKDAALPPAVEELRAHLEGRLPTYMIPSAFVLLDGLPLAPNGKIDHKALPAPEASRPAAKSYEPPRTEAEKIFAEIWAAVLGVERVGIDDNFFALGGDSIRSIQMRAAAKGRGVQFSLPDLFRHQTVRELAEVSTLTEAGPEAASPLRPFELITEADRERMPDDVEDAYPLSALQMGMIFHSEFSSDAVYQNIRSYRLRGPFDARALEASIRRLVARHPVLRTSFDLSSYSEPLQLVHRRAEAPLSIHDLRHLTRPEQGAQMAELIEVEKQHHFDWQHPPLVRFAAHRLSDDTFQFTMTEHHIVIDGWSVANLLAELFRLYLSRTRDGAGGGEPGGDGEAWLASFREYVKMEREALNSEESRLYWESQLESGAMTRLPRWSPLVESNSPPSAASLPVYLPPGLTAGLDELARTMSVPVKSLLLAAHLKVLGFLSGQGVVVTGLVMNGRPEEGGGDKALGLFLNTVPLHLDLSSGTWADLVRQTFESETRMLPHRRYPMAELQKRRPGQPLFETAFNFTHFHVFNALQAFDDLEVLNVDGFGETSFTLLASFDIDLMTSQINLLLGYDRSEITDEQVLNISGYYERALTLMVRDPDAPHDASLLPEAERELLVAAWNSTAAEYPRTHCLHELFEAQAAKTPGAVAVIAGRRRLTYAQLNARADRLAGRLRRLGVGPEVTVGILMERDAELVVALLAVLKAGGAYVPLDPEYPRERLSFMLEDARARVLLTQRRLLREHDWLSGHGAEVVCVDEAAGRAARRAAAGTPTGATPDNLAYVIYTSGSTGRPKGVAIAHRSAVALAYWARDRFGDEELSGVLAATSVCFDLSVFELFVPLSWGGKVVLVPDALRLPDYGARGEVTLVNTVPSVMAELVRAGGVPDSVRTVNLAGEPLPKRLVRELYGLKHVRRVVNLYGPTEDTTYSTGASMPDDAETRVLIGHPIANTQAHVLDERLRPVPVGTPGDLYLGGEGLARGYLNRPDLTAETFIPNPFGGEPGARLYRTGDVARRLADGQLDYLGRRDGQVKVRGFRVELSEIESVLGRAEGVRAAVVLAREDVPGEKRLVAYVVPSEGARLDAEGLRARARERLPEYMVPSAFVLLDALPLNSNGKVDRKALPAPDRAAAEAGAAYVAPRNATESKLAQIWQEVIGVSPVGVNDDFFRLGGHSLSAIRLMARIEKEFERKLPLSILIHTGTVSHLAEVLDAPDAAAASPLVAINPGGEKLPFFCVHPSGGGVLCYVDLSHHLGADRPFYGLQDPILDGARHPYDSIGVMAADYLAALRAAQPAGPYLLGGYSFGGIVAYEMARQLLDGGEEVGALVMLDSMPPTTGRRVLELEQHLGIDDSLILFLDAREQAHQAGKEFALPAGELKRLAPAERLAFVIEEVKKAHLLPAEIDLAEVHRYLHMHRARRDAVRDYGRQTYPGPITLFRTKEPPREPLRELEGLLDPELLESFYYEQKRAFQDPTYGWQELASGPVEVFDVTGNHDSMLLEPHVRLLGSRLAQYLDGATTRKPAAPRGRRNKR